MENKIAVVFPGIGYHTDKPLLYYGKKLAREHGYEIVEASYGGFPKDVKGNAEKMQEAFFSALAQAEELLSGVDFGSFEKTVFLSKSVGTAVAAAYAKKHEIKAQHIYFTPVEQSFAFMEQEGIVFHGTADPWVDTETVKRGCAERKLPLYVKESANHSMETGDVCRDLEILEEIMRLCEAFFQKVG
ncbi:MAG: alpha/beta hydrolase [Lachnospiraceae bacterium]|nr:alpha/beta hydrolase [Lachnospiraceae bacterium]